MVVRALAAAVALGVTAQAGGVPMCVSLLVEAAAPCAMHAHRATDTHDVQVATLHAAASSHDGCHTDAANLGCAAGGVCPTGGPVAPVAVAAPVAPRASTRVTPPGLASMFHSYFAPPLSPPPQA